MKKPQRISRMHRVLDFFENGDPIEIHAVCLLLREAGLSIIEGQTGTSARRRASKPEPSKEANSALA